MFIVFVWWLCFCIKVHISVLVLWPCGWVIMTMVSSEYGSDSKEFSTDMDLTERFIPMVRLKQTLKQSNLYRNVGWYGFWINISFAFLGTFDDLVTSLNSNERVFVNSRARNTKLIYQIKCFIANFIFTFSVHYVFIFIVQTDSHLIIKDTKLLWNVSSMLKYLKNEVSKEIES